MSWTQKLLFTLVLGYLVIFPASCVMNLLCNWGHNGVSAHPDISQGLILWKLTISRTMTRLFNSNLMESNSNRHHSGRIQNCTGQNHMAAFKFLIWLLLKFRNVPFPKLWLREGHALASVLFLIISWHWLDIHLGSISMEFVFLSVMCKGTKGTWERIIVIFAFFCNSIYFLSPKLFVKQWIFQYIRTCH